MTNWTIQSFTNMGFKFYNKQPSHPEHSKGLLQKRVRHEDSKIKFHQVSPEKTLYFISVFVYDFSSIKNYPGDRFSFDAEIHMYRGETVIRLHLNPGDFNNLEDFQDDIMWMFHRLNCRPDPHND